MSFAELLDKYTVFWKSVKTVTASRMVTGQLRKKPGFMRLCAL
jgi:hypothetical protein